MLVNAPLEYINTNYTSLALSSATSVKGTESRSNRNMKADLEEDDTSGKKKLYKNFIYNEIYIYIFILIYWKNMKRYVKNIALTY